MPELPSMPVLALIATLVLCLLVLVWTYARWSMGQGARVLLRGLGTVLALAGLYLSGLAELAGNGIRSIVDWARATPLSTTMTVGFALLGAGLLFFLIGSFLRTRTREQARETRAVRTGKGSSAVTARPTTQQAAPVSRGAKPADDGLSDEDREIAALLDQRGIK
ncbi:hypothetical protein [Luteococcus peritonei]|uniref:Cellulose synthase n=1 Tax=Luteococcus peritonei TaxID=88874 RepID=A0ABW4RY57_9ACTN